MAMTRREYAISLGLAKDGRGRMSKAAHDAINKALAEGMVFSDVPGSGNKDKVVKSEEVKPDIDLFSATPEQLYNDGWFILDGKKKVTVSGREVCRKCMVSLNWHECNTPVIPDYIHASSEMVSVMR